MSLEIGVEDEGWFQRVVGWLKRKCCLSSLFILWESSRLKNSVVVIVVCHTRKPNPTLEKKKGDVFVVGLNSGEGILLANRKGAREENDPVELWDNIIGIRHD